MIKRNSNPTLYASQGIGDLPNPSLPPNQFKLHAPKRTSLRRLSEHCQKSFTQSGTEFASEFDPLWATQSSAYSYSRPTPKSYNDRKKFSFADCSYEFQQDKSQFFQKAKSSSKKSISLQKKFNEVDKRLRRNYETGEKEDKSRLKFNYIYDQQKGMFKTQTHIQGDTKTKELNNQEEAKQTIIHQLWINTENQSEKKEGIQKYKKAADFQNGKENNKLTVEQISNNKQNQLKATNQSQQRNCSNKKTSELVSPKEIEKTAEIENIPPKQQINSKSPQFRERKMLLQLQKIENLEERLLQKIARLNREIR